MITLRFLKFGSSLLIFWLILLTLIVSQPDWAISMLAQQSPQVTYFVDTQKPIVALTIDDGPDSTTTPQILDLLKQHQAHATFFLITSHIPGNEAVVTRMVEENHEIANHLMVDEPSIELTPTEFERQLVAAHRILSQYSTVRWFRPGSGRYNAKMLAIVTQHNYQTALGSIYPFDPHIPSSWFATRQILWNIRPGSIIILHDNGARGKRTAATLAKILPELDHRGYRVVTLSELLNLPTIATQEKGGLQP